jgi:ABC-type transporter Mla MlaB component
MKPPAPADSPKIVALSGDLDIFAVAKVWDSIHGLPDDPCSSLVIDLAGMEDFDPSGLQLLLALRRSCRERDLPLQFTGIPAGWSERIRALGAVSAIEGPPT